MFCLIFALISCNHPFSNFCQFIFPSICRQAASPPKIICIFFYHTHICCDLSFMAGIYMEQIADNRNSNTNQNQQKLIPDSRIAEVPDMVALQSNASAKKTTMNSRHPYAAHMLCIFVKINCATNSVIVKVANLQTESLIVSSFEAISVSNVIVPAEIA